jgi:hypothetical protein
MASKATTDGTAFGAVASKELKKSSFKPKKPAN